MNRFVELLDKLAAADVRFLVVGGGAVNLHGHLRVTRDVDILIEASEANARRLLAALATWGTGAGAGLTLAELTEPAVGCLRVWEEFPLDVFTLMRSRRLDREFLFADLMNDAPRTRLPGSGAEVAFLSIPRLVDLKTGTGRAKDRHDVDILEQISRGRHQRVEVDVTQIDVEPAPEGGSSEGEEAGE